MEPFVKNAADPQQIKEAGKKEKIARDREINDLRVVMDSQNGRRFVYSILDFAGINRLSFTGNSNTYFNEGGRNVGLWLKDMLEKNLPDLYLLMLKENLKGDHNA